MELVRKNRSGFTLIELIAVTAVVALLIALTLPAVMASREASRNLLCKNNLKQITLGLIDYQSTHTVYPGPFIFSNVKDPSGTFAFSPYVHMLPQIEQAALFNNINFCFEPAYSNGIDANITVMTQVIDILACPSEPDALVQGLGRVNYRFSYGTNTNMYPALGVPYTGAFAANHFYGSSDYPDGLSTTVCCSERIQGDWIVDAFDPGGDYLLGALGFDYLPPEAAIKYCQSLLVTSNAIESKSGESWFLTGFHFTCYNHCNTPNAKNNDCSLDLYDSDLPARVVHNGIFTARSRHSGGVNIALMDGSVKGIRNEVNLEVWRALSTRAGGEAISASEF